MYNNNNNDNNNNYDDALYSRQVYALSHDAMKKITSTSVLVIGLDGLGIEIVKDIVLSGVKSVTLIDDNLVDFNDLSSQFYLNENQVGKIKRSEGCYQKVCELNHYVSIHLASQNDIKNGGSESFLKQFSVVVTSNQPIQLQLSLNDFCHRNSIHFIAAECRGVFGSIFNDFGDDFTVLDKNGEEPESYLIEFITQEKTGFLVNISEVERINLEDGDFVLFKEIRGLDQLNELKKPLPIKVVGAHSVYIEHDITQYLPNQYFSNGIMYQVKQSKSVSFKPLSKILSDPVSLAKFTDTTSTYSPKQMMLGFHAVHQFNHINGYLPRPHNFEDSKLVLEYAQKLSDGYKFVDPIDTNLITMISFQSRGNLSPMQAIIGGIAGQEILKSVSEKFSPIEQFLFFESVDSLPDNYLNLPEDEFTPHSQSSRYDGQIITIGRKVHETILNLNYFLVGAGAIGCEIIKTFSMMGLGSGPNGQIHLTDMDTIEKSNLSRQFLFRIGDINQLKSETAANAVLQMNPQIKIKSYSSMVGRETESIFNEQFYQSLDGVCNALDNITARLYMDEQCILYHKPLLDSGTLGPKGNTQVVIPNITESYGSSRDPPERSVYLCTLHSFPSNIHHTIQWARDIFEGLFKNVPTNVNSYLSNPDYFKTLETFMDEIKLETLKGIQCALSTDKPLDFNDCLNWARIKFEEYFKHSIERLLESFPTDMILSTGLPFWSGPKRAPTPIIFDSNNQLHMDFIIATAKLHAFIYGIIVNPIDLESIKKVVNHTIIPPFESKRVYKPHDNDDQEHHNVPTGVLNSSFMKPDTRELLDNVYRKLPHRSEFVGYKMNPINFEKDDDNNSHIDFITSVSNLRATIYRIELADKHKTKGIAGNIIPALVTTTSIVAGLSSLELLKLHQNKSIDKFKNNFLNLAIPYFGSSEPIAPIKNKFTNGKEWTLWDKIEIDMGRDITVQEFIDYLKDKYQVEVDMISIEVSLLYAMFFNKETKEKNLKSKVIELFKEKCKTKVISSDKKLFVVDVVCSSIDTGEEMELPSIKYRI
eukprot:gene2838-3528_t